MSMLKAISKTGCFSIASSLNNETGCSGAVLSWPLFREEWGQEVTGAIGTGGESREQEQLRPLADREPR